MCMWVSVGAGASGGMGAVGALSAPPPASNRRLTGGGVLCLATPQLDQPLLRSVVGTLHDAVAELEQQSRHAADAAHTQRLMRSGGSAAAHRGAVADDDVGATGKSAPVGRKPVALALAEEALAVLHDVAERKVAARKVAAGALTLTDGLVGLLLWSVAGLTGSIYPTLLAEVYPCAQ